MGGGSRDGVGVPPAGAGSVVIMGREIHLKRNRLVNPSRDPNQYIHRRVIGEIFGGGRVFKESSYKSCSGLLS